MYAIYVHVFAYSEAQRDIIIVGGGGSVNIYDINSCVLRLDLNDSTDFALRTCKGSAFQKEEHYIYISKCFITK